MHTHQDHKNFNWFNITAQKTVIENCNYLVLVCIDVTEIKSSQSQLSDEKKWLITAMESGKTSVWDWNVETNAALWSNSFWELFGIEKLPGRTPSYELWENAIHPDDREMIMESMKQAIAQRAEINVQYRILHPDGSCRWVMDVARPILDKYGEIKRFCGISMDITDQKKFEDEVVLIRENLDDLLEKFSIGWFQTNLNDNSTTRTIEHARIFGYDNLDMNWSLEKFLGHVVDEEREKVRNIIFGSVEKKKDFLVNCKIRKTTGDIRRIMVSASLILDDHGNPTHIVGIVQDVTDLNSDNANLKK